MRPNATNLRPYHLLVSDLNFLFQTFKFATEFRLNSFSCNRNMDNYTFESNLVYKQFGVSKVYILIYSYNFGVWIYISSNKNSNVKIYNFSAVYLNIGLWYRDTKTVIQWLIVRWIKKNLFLLFSKTHQAFALTAQSIFVYFSISCSALASKHKIWKLDRIYFHLELSSVLLQDHKRVQVKKTPTNWFACSLTQ